MADLSPATVVCLALGLVIAINGLLIFSLTRGGLQRQVELMRTAARTAQSPWKAEDDALGELHRRVAQLAEDQTDDPG
jgi:hypothetical protein